MFTFYQKPQTESFLKGIHVSDGERFQGLSAEAKEQRSFMTQTARC